MSGVQLALVVLAAWFSVLLCALAVWVAAVKIARGRARRRRGYLRPSLSAYGYASPGTALRARTSTGCSKGGPQPGAPDGLALRAALSRTTAPGSSGNATASPHGDPTTAASNVVPIAQAGYMYGFNGDELVDVWRTW